MLVFDSAQVYGALLPLHQECGNSMTPPVQFEGGTTSTCSNVRVAVRLRPLNSRERLAGADELIICEAPSKQIIAGPEHCFTYDSVFGADSLQEDLFTELTQPLLNSFMAGFNCTILAYGQVHGLLY